MKLKIKKNFQVDVPK